MAAVSSRYARAFADVVMERKLDSAQMRRELRLLSDIVQQNSELRRVWEAPALPAAQKRGVLDALAKRTGISPTVRNFAAVLIDHERIPMMDQIVSQVEAELDRRLNLAQAEITSARDLSPEEKRVLEAEVGRLTGKQVRASYFRDPNLLGGAVIKVGSTIYDGSVLGQLNKIREHLVEAGS
ncbi:MAG TPA: ATP synthase F1 subunit delta [Terriglobales bacterium]|nr:ATP synthase F1 subunit delta [Terriglobales bacterium]